MGRIRSRLSLFRPERQLSQQQLPHTWPAMVAFFLILLLAFGLRVYDLGNLTLYGDYAYSVYSARMDWAAIALESSIDSHPPFYYYLLHIWMLVSGQNELTIRMLSAMIGVLVIPATYSLGVRHLDRRVGMLGSLLVAVSPSLVHYSRLPRMYGLLVLLGLLSIYTLTRAIELDRRRDWLAFFITTSLLAYTHYYGLALIAAEAAYYIWAKRSRAWRNVRSLATAGALAAVCLPWLFFAAKSSAAATARTISNAPWPKDIAGILAQFWIPFNVGDFLSAKASLALSLVMLGLWLTALYLERHHLLRRWRDVRFLVFSIAIPIVGSLIIFLVAPYFVRPRFFIFCIPPYLLLLATVLSGKRRWLATAGVVTTLLVSSYALQDMYRVEPYYVEGDAIQLTDRIQQIAQPEDAVVFQAFWQIGYFTTHYRGAMPATYSMRDLPLKDAEATLSRSPRVWLAMFRVPERTPEYRLE